jgi:pyridoxamine 5'-phosphate oxidase
VLVTGVVDGALRFHTSTPTQKTRDLAAHPQASGVFLWPALGRQAVVGGPVAELDRDATEAAFEERPAQLRRLAWVYDALLPSQTGPLQAIEPGAPERAFAEAPDATAPPTWTTFALTPVRIELWRSQGPDAPAARTRYVRHGGGWQQATVLP